MEMLPEEELKSAAVKVAAPLVEPSAAASAIERVEPENESGVETVVDWTAPAAVEERSVEITPEMVRLVVEAVPETVMAVVEAYGKVLAEVAELVMAPATVMAPVAEMLKNVEVAKAAVEEATENNVALYVSVAPA